MANMIEIRERQKYHLMSLLKIKKANSPNEVKGLSDELLNAVGVMEQEDVAYVEKLVGVKAF